MSVPSQMYGVALTRHGGPECLVIHDDLPVPQPGHGDVLIRVGASAVNNTDINTRLAWYSKGEGAAEDAGWAGTPIGFPRIQGIDVCGEIAGVGPGVAEDRIGERVLVEPCLRERGGETLSPPWFLGSECDGGFAEYVVVAARHAHRVNSTLSDAELASFPCSYSTAENMLTRAGIRDGDRVLITGASGGVGSAATQLCRARGAIPVAVTSGGKGARLLEVGAAEVIDRSAVRGASGFDAAIDLVGGPDFGALLNAVNAGGSIATAGAVAGPEAMVDLRTVYLKDLSIFGCTALDAGVFANLVGHIEAGRIAPLVSATYPLREIHAAQEAFLARTHVGKIALQVAGA